MIGQRLSNKNENATIPKFNFFSELNKALAYAFWASQIYKKKNTCNTYLVYLQ